MTPEQLFDRKVPTPSAMTTAQWDHVRLELRERAFFMAAVTKAEVLQVYQDTTAKYVRGEISEQEARRELREGLARTGYAPRPGEEGGIKDLRTGRRMDVVLRTNAAMAAGKAGYDKQLQSLKVWPAKRMVRLQNRMVPRNWRARWATKAGRPGVNAEDMSALVTSPVWVELSRFGAPYAPYDFGSGMGDLPVRRDEAERLGLLGPVRPAEPEPVAPSFNEGLEAEPAVTVPALRAELAKDLRGLAEWHGEKIVFTDPNGTRPVAPADLARTVATPNTADIPLLQAETLRTWAANGPATMTRDSDALYHFRRAVRRVLPLTQNEPLALERGFPSAEARAAVLAQLQPGQIWEPRARPFPFSAFRKVEGDQPDPADQTDLAFALLLRVVRHQNAKDLTPAVDALADEDAHGHHVLFERGTRFRVASVATDESGTVTVTLTEEGTAP